MAAGDAPPAAAAASSSGIRAIRVLQLLIICVSWPTAAVVGIEFYLALSYKWMPSTARAAAMHCDTAVMSPTLSQPRPTHSLSGELKSTGTRRAQCQWVPRVHACTSTSLYIFYKSYNSEAGAAPTVALAATPSLSRWGAAPRERSRTAAATCTCALPRKRANLKLWHKYAVLTRPISNSEPIFWPKFWSPACNGVIGFS